MNTSDDLKLLDYIFVLIEPKDREKMYIQSFVNQYGLVAFLDFLDVFDFSDETLKKLSCINTVLLQLKGSESA